MCFLHLEVLPFDCNRLEVMSFGPDKRVPEWPAVQLSCYIMAEQLPTRVLKKKYIDCLLRAERARVQIEVLNTAIHDVKARHDRLPTEERYQVGQPLGYRGILWYRYQTYRDVGRGYQRLWAHWRVQASRYQAELRSRGVSV